MKITKSKAYCTTAVFLMYNLIFVRFPYFSYASMIRNFSVILLGFMLMPCALSIIKSLHIRFKFLLFSYLFAVCVSGLINMNTNIITHSLYSAIIYSLAIVETVLLICYIKKKHGIFYLYQLILGFHLTYTLLNDILIMFKPDMFFTNSYYYLLGNKFAVAYRHIELIALLFIYYYRKNTFNKLKFAALIVLFVLLSLWVFNIVKGGVRESDSATGYVSLILLLLLVVVVPPGFLTRTASYLIVLLGSGLFVVIFDWVLSLSLVKSFIVDYLKRDITLTGRTDIYSRVPSVLQNHLLFGYGHGSSYETWMNHTHIYPNSQNGLVDCIVEQGLIATIILVLMFVYIIFHCKISKNKYVLPVLAIVYVYTLLSSVEVTISVVYVWWVLLLYFSLDNYTVNVEPSLTPIRIKDKEINYGS